MDKSGGEAKSETNSSPEIPQNNWRTLTIVQRHGAYDSRRPDNFPEIREEEKVYGGLTEQSIPAIRERTLTRIESILAKEAECTDFLVINSPTHWLGHPELRQRAAETAELVSETILESLKAKGLSTNQLLNLSGRFHGETTRPDARLGEALMFDVPEFANFLRSQSDGQGPQFWENFYLDIFAGERENLGAEGPADIAKRTQEFLNVVSRFASMYHIKNPDRRLVVWIVSHSEVMESYAQKSLGVPMEIAKFAYNDCFTISINPEGQSEVRIGSTIY